LVFACVFAVRGGLVVLFADCLNPGCSVKSAKFVSYG